MKEEYDVDATEEEIDEIVWPIFIKKKLREVAITLTIILSICLSVLIILLMINWAKQYYSIKHIMSAFAISVFFMSGILMTTAIIIGWMQSNWEASREEAREKIIKRKKNK